MMGPCDPDESHASTRSVYSPGSLNVAVVVAFAVSTLGDVSLNVDAAGRRGTCSTRRRAPGHAVPPLPRFRTLSSVAQTCEDSRGRKRDVEGR